MRANVLSTPTFRYLGGNFIDVEFEQLSPKPWSDIDNEDSIAELNEVFTDKKVGISEEAIKLNEEKAMQEKL